LAKPLSVNSESDAWAALKALVNNEIDADDVDLASSSFAWASVSLKANGLKYQSSMPASFMRGLVDLQDNFLRSSALIIKDSSYITKLSNEVRSDLDMVFVVGAGSTDIKTILQEQIGELVTKVSEKLSGRQIVVLVLSLALIYGGYSVYSLHLQNNLEIETLKQDGAKDDKYLDIIKQLIEKDVPDKERAAILKKAEKIDKRVSQIRKLGDESRDSIFSHASDVDSLTVQGIQIQKATVADINRRSRRSAEDVELTETVKVEAIDAAEAHHFRVKLRRSSGNTVFAMIRDIEANQRTINALWKAESSRNPINVQIEGRQIGRDLKDVTIKKAWTPRNRS
jgi:hypothetical protein